MPRLFIIFFLLLHNLISNGQSKDSIIEVVSNHLPSHFICNNVPCSGVKQGYYINGNIAINGRFRKGKAIGKVNNYSLSGHLETVRYFRKGNIQRALSYDTSGRLTRDLNWKKQQSTTYHYDADGQATKKEIFIWKNVGWSNGVTEIYEKKSNIWVRVDNRQ
jgi:antitoxin component YwqK of YwqJK toxin-antitoxin module